MSFQDFYTEVRAAAKQYAPQYGIDTYTLIHAMLLDAFLEGGLGDTAGKGDNGYSVGRFQFNTTPGSGGVGEQLLKQGHSLDEIQSDKFQAWYWAPYLAGELASTKGNEAQAIFQAERPAKMYDSQRIDQGTWAANQILAGSTPTSTGGIIDTAGNAASAAAGAASNAFGLVTGLTGLNAIGNALQAIANGTVNFFGWIFDWHHWARLGWFWLGGALAVGGLYLIAQSQGVAPSPAKIAESAA